MLSERLTELFRLLQCSNTDIARFADCSPSNISRLKKGTREPEPGSCSIARLAMGIYRYADYENMLYVLCSLCGTEDMRADVLIPSIINWLYETHEYKLPESVTPKSKQEQISRQQNFSARLNKVMTILDYSNSRLAADLNVDASLISRCRTGLYYPNRNVEIKQHLTELILSRAEKTGRVAELAALCSIDSGELGPESFAEWLYEPDESRNSEIAESLFHSIDSYKPGLGIPSNMPHLPSIQIADRYWEKEGLRNAVIRFLSEAADEGGELLLYSDEPMEWMSGDPEFFAMWASLMTLCLQNGVHIRIIHNIDRGGLEMVSAIRGWFPLYLTGKIEPYVFRKTENLRFHHTIFLRPKHSCILGFSPAEMGEHHWYDYITDKTRLDVLMTGFNSMLSSAAPLLKTYPANKADTFWKRYYGYNGKANAILRGLSIATIPEELLRNMLSRSEISESRKEEVINFYHSSSRHFRQILINGELHEFLCLPDRETVLSGQANVNSEAEMDGFRIFYTPKEYAAHVTAVQELVRSEKHYHLTLLPNAPFQDLQVFTMKDAAAIVRCREPYTAFVFYNPLLLQSVDYYCDMLADQYASDRMTVIQMLENVRKSGHAE